MTVFSRLATRARPSGLRLSGNRGFSTLNHSPIVCTLKDKIQDLAAQKADKIALAKKSNAIIHSVTADQCFGGMRGIPAMVTETSDLDAHKGITYRGYSLEECNEKLPKGNAQAEAGLPEAAWWLLLTGEIPTEKQVKINSLTMSTVIFDPSHHEVFLVF